jgi:hypothetical protein
MKGKYPMDWFKLIEEIFNHKQKIEQIIEILVKRIQETKTEARLQLKQEMIAFKQEAKQRIKAKEKAEIKRLRLEIYKKQAEITDLNRTLDVNLSEIAKNKELEPTAPLPIETFGYGAVCYKK